MITIFTPVYNRAYIIDKLYNSLCAQTDNRFEWLVIDDGSSDNIDVMMKKYQSEKHPFEIKYYKQKNGGKHRAINYALSLIESEYFFIVDSDDYLSSDAIKIVYEWIEDTKDIAGLIGVSGQRAHPDGKLIGSYPNGKKYIDVKQCDRKRKGIVGDKAEIYKTSVLKTKRFPEFDGETFISESALMYQFSIEGYKVRYYPDIIYYGDYLEDGLTKKSGKTKDNYKGYCFFEKVNMRACKFPDNILSMVRFIEAGKEENINQLDIMKGINVGIVRYCCLLFLVKIKSIVRR